MSGFGDNAKDSSSPFGAPVANPFGPPAATAANPFGLSVQAPPSSPGSLLGAAPSPATSGFGAAPLPSSFGVVLGATSPTAESDSSPGSSSEVIVTDESIVAELASMGFTENACRRAAIATGNTSADVAIEWVFEHTDDPDLNNPIESAPAKSELTSGDTSKVFAPESPKAQAPVPAPNGLFGCAPSTTTSGFGVTPSPATTFSFGAAPPPFQLKASPGAKSPGSFPGSTPIPAFKFGSPATPKASSASVAPPPVTPGEIVPDSRRNIEKRYTVINPTSGLAIRESEQFSSKKVGELKVGDVVDSSEECDILVTSGSTKIQFTVVKLNDGKGWVSKCSPTHIFLEEPTTVEQWY
jgi:hypothetical protein